jgi:hypothetical protein
MINYEFERLCNDTYGYLINNSTKIDIDIDGNPITLSSIVKHEFPENYVYLFCKENIVKLYFNNELSELEFQELTNLINNYQTISGI